MISGIGGGALKLMNEGKSGDTQSGLTSLICVGNRKKKKERERIKQFSIWFQETDTARQKEYVKRRQRRSEAANQRLDNIKSIKYLLIPTGIFLVTGTAILLAANLRSVAPDSIFEKRKSLFNAVGGVLVGLGLLCFFVVKGCISHINHRVNKSKKEVEEAELAAEKMLPQNFPVFVFPENKIPDPFNQTKSGRTRPPLKTSMSVDAASTRRAPKLGAIGKRSRSEGYFVLDSMDSGTSVKTEQTFIKSSDSEPVFGVDAFLPGPSSVSIRTPQNLTVYTPISERTSSDSLEDVPGATCANYSVMHREAVFELTESNDSLNNIDNFNS